jgi:hypothetical protein
MKKLFSPPTMLVVLIIAISVAHCSKKEVQKNIIIQAMTNGRWVVQHFTENTLDVSTEFTTYEFQFYENGTVQSISGSVITNGTWTANPDERTISSIFPTGNDTLKRLNDTWKIFNNSYTLVEANPTNITRTAYLKLIKK